MDADLRPYNKKSTKGFINGVQFTKNKVIKMKAFRVTGSYDDPRQKKQPFSIEMAAEDENAVREKALSTIGSKHKLKRWQIDITDVAELPADQVTNHVVKYQIGE